MAFGGTDEGPHSRVKKLGIGTVQFGLNYGISNSYGKTSQEEAGRILKFAKSAGINVLDTAAAYGESEKTLGSLLESPSPFRIVTKTPKLDDGKNSPAFPRESFSESLSRLKVSRTYGLLIHHVSDLLGKNGDSIWEEMRALRDSGKVEKIGVSVYRDVEIDHILKRYDIDLIQIPFNIFDQRLKTSGHLSRLKEKSIEIHARSAFLQGLLLMDPTNLDPYFSPYSNNLFAFRSWSNEQGLSQLSAALGYSLSIAEIDCVLVGVNSESQLREIVDAAKFRADFGDAAKFASNEIGLLDPSLWKLTPRRP